MKTITLTCLMLALGVALVGGCKSEDGARKSDTDKAYEPPPRAPQPPPPDAAPARVDKRVDEDASVVQCVRECVEQGQMRAESPESIRAGCVRSCGERCVEACVARAERRGQQDEGTAAACEKSCAL